MASVPDASAGAARESDGDALAQECSAAALALPGNVTAEVVAPLASGWTSPSSFPPRPGEPVGVAFCRIAGLIEGDIGFEVWLPDPAAFNGRLLGAGVGGEAGYINYADMARGVEQGFVTASSDTGHARGEMWIDDPHKTENYSHRSYHLMTVAAKEIAAAFYGEAVDRSYFIGCSGGGRLGMREMQLHPADYDGMLIGAPGLDVPLLAARFMQVYLAQANNPGGELTQADWQLVAEGAVKRCDADDGLADGIIADPRRCSFRPRELLCRVGESEGCLTAPKLAAVESIVAPLTDARGIEHDYGLLPGITARPGGLPPLPALMFGLAVRGDADWGPKDFDMAADLRAARAHFAPMDASDPDLSEFAERGGRVIFYHGWADASVQPEGTIDYVAGLVPERGEVQADYAQLYMVPGMEHCSGGAATDAFGGSGDRRPSGDPDSDMLSALIAWVERGDRPDVIRARRFGADGKVNRTRPLCPWPLEAVWDGSGQPDDAASFHCTAVNDIAQNLSGEKDMSSDAATASLWPVTQIIADRDDTGSAVMNVFRLEDGTIMEHWDVTQALPENTASGRPLG